MGAILKQHILKKIIKILIVVFIIINILLGLFGASSILLTISIYFSVWFVFSKLIDILSKDSNKNKNYKLFLLMLVASLSLSEVILKYVVKSNLSYSERNGAFFYRSMYKQRKLENFSRRYVFKQEDFQISTHPANSSEYVRKPEFSYIHNFNSLGLRDKEPVLDSNLRTIIGLGDSFTEGVGSPQDSTWLKLMEGNLNRLDQNLKIQTINGGYIGSDPIAEFILLERKLIKYMPEIVIVCINNSDISDLIVRGGKERFNNRIVKYQTGPWWEFFYSYSYIFRSIAHSIFNVNYLLLTNKQYEIEKDLAIKKLKEIICQDYKDLAKKHSFKLAVILHPMQHELEQKDFVLDDLYLELKKDSTLLTINLYNEYYAFQKDNENNFMDLYWPKDLHHNSSGYKLWADIVSDKILQLLEYSESISQQHQ